MGMGIGRETGLARVRESNESVASARGESERCGDGGLNVEEVAVKSSREDSETRVGLPCRAINVSSWSLAWVSDDRCDGDHDEGRKLAKKHAISKNLGPGMS